MSDSTPRARSKPLPRLPPRADSTSSTSSSSSASTATHAQLKRTRALGRGHGYSRSADLGHPRPTRSASPVPAPVAAEALATLNPRPPRLAQRQRSYSLDSSESPSPHSASDVVSWYAAMPDNTADTSHFRVESEEPESSSDYEDNKQPSRRVASPSKPPSKQSVIPVTDVKSATLAFVSARRSHPTRVDPDPGVMPMSLGAALFGYKHKPIVPLQPRAPSPQPPLSHDVRSADTTPTVSPRVHPTGLPGLARPRMERELTFMTDISDSGDDGEGDELFDEVRTHNLMMNIRTTADMRSIAGGRDVESTLSASRSTGEGIQAQGGDVCPWRVCGWPLDLKARISLTHILL